MAGSVSLGSPAVSRGKCLTEIYIKYPLLPSLFGQDDRILTLLNILLLRKKKTELDVVEPNDEHGSTKKADQKRYD